MTTELRPIPDTDFDAYHTMMNDISIARMAGTVPHPVSREWAVERLLKRRVDEAAGTLAQRGLYRDGVLVGDASYFFNDEGLLEIGYAIAAPYRGQGLATLAARLIVDLVRAHGHKGAIWAAYMKDNPASGRVLAKVGFTPAGDGIGTSLGRGGQVALSRMMYGDDVRLRPTGEEDIAPLFALQDDHAAHIMAAGGRLMADEATFRAHVHRVTDGGARFISILYEGRLAGYLASFERFGKYEISYWLGRDFWGKGIMSRALGGWLQTARPSPDGLYARAAKDHLASARVLEKCGFTVVGEESYHSDIRETQVEEWLYWRAFDQA